jgi:hypothetical protein
MKDRFPTPHAEHDLLLVAAVVDRDPTAADRLAAERQIATCPSCAELAADLRAIALAAAALPAAERTRDFTLRPQDAARLRPRGWQRLAAAFGAARLEVLRPLGAGLATVGVAGLLLATLPAIQLPMGASGAATGLYSTGVKSGAGAEVAPAASAVGSAAPIPAAASAAPAPAASGVFGPLAASPAPSAGSVDDRGSSAGYPRKGVEGAEGGAPSSAPPAATDNRVAVAQPEPTARTNDQAPQLATPGGVDIPLAAVSAACFALGVSLIALRRATNGRARAA